MSLAIVGVPPSLAGVHRAIRDADGGDSILGFGG